MATVHAVREASVVIANGQPVATAIRYIRDRDDIPIILASGEGDVALRIEEAARRYGVPVVHNALIAQALALANLQVGDTIPEALYQPIAEVLGDLWDSASAAP